MDILKHLSEMSSAETSSEQLHQKLKSTKFVPFSARLMAALRARETERRDRLFVDSLARKLAGTDAIDFAREKLTPRYAAYVAVRTRLFDDFIVERTQNIDQVVILASGMDTRVYRLALPDRLSVYELDMAGVLAYKLAMLETVMPRCRHQAIAADLRQPWTHLLLNQGYQRDRPSLLNAISELTASGSHLGLDLVNQKALEYEPYLSCWLLSCSASKRHHQESQKPGSASILLARDTSL